jgi:hypothetical protein
VYHGRGYVPDQKIPAQGFPGFSVTGALARNRTRRLKSFFAIAGNVDAVYNGSGPPDRLTGHGS